MILSKRVREYMRDNKVSASMLGRMLGVTTRTIVGWKTGRNFPQKRHHEKVSEVLGIDISAYIKK